MVSLESPEKRPRVGPWHQPWQDRFLEEQREVRLPGISRRADVMVGDLVLELQHSWISTAEIEQRTQDYRSEGKTVAWLLDGTKGLQFVTERGGGHLLLFSQNHQTFRAMELTVLVDAGEDRVYLVPLDMLRGGCAWVAPPRSITEVVAVIRNPLRHKELLAHAAPQPACFLRVFQDPPGSGKTYRLIRFCVLGLGPEGSQYSHYRCIFVLTKPHSAKNVVHQEFVRQLTDAEAEGVTVLRHVATTKSYYYRLQRGKDEQFDVFFATVDSFMYHMADRSGPRGSTDFFKNLTKAIEENGPNVDSHGRGRFQNFGVTLDARALVCWDEATKLERHHLHALAKIMDTCAVDGVLAGDVMQSIENSQNSMRLASNEDGAYIQTLLPHCAVEVTRGNEIRRFGLNLVEALCQVVKFEEYGAPVPHAATDIQRESDGELFVHGVPATFRGCESCLYEATVATIWEELLKDLAEFNMLPHELLIVTPLVKVNPVVDELRDRLDEFWKTHIEGADVRAAAMLTEAGRDFYEAYDGARKPRWLAYFHRSEEGRPVDTTLSEFATRIVSVHSSQGDGRRFVYVVGLSEGALKCFTRGRTDVLEYEALWTVLMSRAKRRLRIFVEEKYDDAWIRLGAFMSQRTASRVEPTFGLGTKPDLCRADLSNEYGFADAEKFRSFQENAVSSVEKANEGSVNSQERSLVEDSHHDVRMAIYNFAFVARMLRDEQVSSPKKKQIFAVLSKAARLDVKGFEKASEYHKTLRGVEQESFYVLTEIPLLRDSRMPDAFDALLKYAEQAKRAMEDLLHNREDVIDIDYKGMLVLYHIMDIFHNKQYARTKLDMVYDVIDSSRSSHDGALQQHYFNVLQSAREAADHIIEHEYLVGSPREWKLGHLLQLRTEEEFLPHFQVPFFGFTESAAVVILLTPRLDKTNIPRVTGHALALALLLEKYVKKDKDRIAEGAQHWVCVAPLEGGCPVWINARQLLKENREVAVDWLVLFLTDACEQTHPAIKNFYEWHLKRGDAPSVALKAAKTRLEKIGGLGSYVLRAFQRMDENAEEGSDFGADIFTDFLMKRMRMTLTKVKSCLMRCSTTPDTADLNVASLPLQCQSSM